MTAYRAINLEYYTLTNAQQKNFELHVLYLKELKEKNVRSIIWNSLDNKYFKNLHVFPRFMNGSLHLSDRFIVGCCPFSKRTQGNSLCCVCPFRSKWSLPYRAHVCSHKWRWPTWRNIFTLLKDACPILKQLLGFDDLCVGSLYCYPFRSSSLIMARVWSPRFAKFSQKCQNKLMQSTMANVCPWYDKEYARLVSPMAETFPVGTQITLCGASKND